MPYKRGELWLVDFGMVRGYEQAGERPAIVLQNDELTLHTIVVVPTSTSWKGALKGTVPLLPSKGGLDQQTTALCQQVRAVDENRFKKRIGKLPEAQLDQIESALAYVIGLV